MRIVEQTELPPPPLYTAAAVIKVWGGLVVDSPRNASHGTDKHRDIATYRLNRPRGLFGENV